MTVACVLVPRFFLIAACGKRRELLKAPAALAPEPGGELMVGQASGAAEAHGVREGMRLGEALARCPDLALIPPDPDRAAELWEEALRRLEEIGAAVESDRPGDAFFRADGLRGIYGDLAGTLMAARRAVRMPVRIGAGPNRFAAFAAARVRGRTRTAGRQERRDPVIGVPDLRDFLSPLPVALLESRLGNGEKQVRKLVATLEKLGVGTLGALAELPADSVADRFGALGLEARRLARGEDMPLRPRQRHEEMVESLELPEAAGGQQLERALGLLIDRLLASPQRRERTLRRLRIGARLAGGGSWSADVALRRPSASAEILRLALGPKLQELPGPAQTLSVRALELGPRGGEQGELASRPAERRRSRLAEAVRQVQAAAGPASLMRVLEVDTNSRVPERWTMLTPFTPPES